MPDTVVVIEPPRSNVHVTTSTTSMVEINSGASNGLSLDDVAFVHYQGVASATWTINHPLAFNPAVTIVDSAGTVVEGGVQYLNAHTIEVTFDTGAFSGTAYLS
jgi:hypothetical protein